MLLSRSVHPLHCASLTRRRFLQQLLGLSTWTAAPLLFSQTIPSEPILRPPGSVRFAFLTDLHLLFRGDKRSDEGIAACLQAVERLSPRPDFILVGGDLVHCARDLTISQATSQYDLFQTIWRKNTSLPTHWTFGNHDLVGTYNPTVSPTEPGYGKALFRQKFHLSKLFYSFDHGGWHFVVLDDIESLPGQTYQGRVFAEELLFLKQDLEAHQNIPTVLCLHIPLWTTLAVSIETHFRSLCCTNREEVEPLVAHHRVRLVLSGHLHQLQLRRSNDIQFVNCGAVCGNYWKGPMMGYPEGFGVVDLFPDGRVSFVYHDYGWKALEAG